MIRDLLPFCARWTAVSRSARSPLRPTPKTAAHGPRKAASEPVGPRAVAERLDRRPRRTENRFFFELDAGATTYSVANQPGCAT
jgi:hypothetical protein